MKGLKNAVCLRQIERSLILYLVLYILHGHLDVVVPAEDSREVVVFGFQVLDQIGEITVQVDTMSVGATGEPVWILISYNLQQKSKNHRIRDDTAKIEIFSSKRPSFIRTTNWAIHIF